MIPIMETQYLTSLDEYFCAQYSDYVKLSALEGYEMPDVVSVGADGNIQRKDSEVMRLCRQKNRAELLARFKEGLADTEFTFNFSFRPFRDRMRDPFRKFTFAKVLKDMQCLIWLLGVHGWSGHLVGHIFLLKIGRAHV